MPIGFRPTGRQASQILTGRSRDITVSSSHRYAADVKPTETGSTVTNSVQKAEAMALEAESKPKEKTINELDEELKLKLEGISGEGGASGLEYENGKAVAMKRSVKNNMFRLI